MAMGFEATEDLTCTIKYPEKKWPKHIQTEVCATCADVDPTIVVGSPAYDYEDDEHEHHYRVALRNIAIGARFSVQAALRTAFPDNRVTFEDDGDLGEAEEDTQTQNEAWRGGNIHPPMQDKWDD